MRVLKNPAGIRIVPRVVSDARAEAMALIARAGAEADAVRERARQEGLALGRADAAALMVRAAAREAARADDQRDAVTTLALEIARTILDREAAAGETVLRDVVQRAVGRVRRARTVVLRVHPEDLDQARAGARTWLPAGVEPDVLAIEQDATVDRGGVVVDSEIGRIDARLSVQFEAIARAIRG